MREAVIEFASHGFGGGRVDRIVSRAGVSQQMVYYYYGDKAGLYNAVVRQVYEAMHAIEASMDEEHRGCVSAIARIISSTWSHYVAYPDHVSILNAHDALSVPDQGIGAALPPQASPILPRIAALLRKGAEEGIFRPSADPVSVYLSIHSLCLFYLAHRRAFSVLFGRELGSGPAMDTWRIHVEETVVAMLRPSVTDVVDHSRSPG